MADHTPARPPTSRPAGRAYLDVPYADKDEAKARGARWDPTGAALVRPAAAHSQPGAVDGAGTGARSAPRGGPDVRGRAVRRHGAHVVLVHQRPHLRHATGLGTTPRHDHPPGRAIVRGVRRRRGPHRAALVGSARAVGLQRTGRGADAAPADLPVLGLSPLDPPSATPTSPAAPARPLRTCAPSPT